MKLSDGEKITLLMLSDIYEKLEKVMKFDTGINSKLLKSAILENQLWSIPWGFNGVLSLENEKCPKNVTEVIDILDMWNLIEKSYEDFSDEEKRDVKKNASLLDKDPKFVGFDGNNEHEHRSIALFLINDLGRFKEFKDRELNSHMRLIDTYKRMLEVFLPIRANAEGEYLNVNNLVLILNEKTHPNNR